MAPEVTLDRVVYVTRKFAGTVGGMETLARAIWSVLADRFEDSELAAPAPHPRLGGLATLPQRATAAVLRRGTEFCLFGDPVVYALLAPVVKLSGVPHAVVVHGLDLTYDRRLYRGIVLPVLRRAPAVIAISRATGETARGKGIAAERIHILRLGIDIGQSSPDARSACRGALVRSGLVPDDSFVVLTLGRLVPRKGVAWFIAEVLPSLPEKVVYLVAGDGPDRERIKEAAREAGCLPRIRMLGEVDEPTRVRLLLGSDVFVQPNIPMDGDMEGFGLVTIESAMHNTVTVASALEGIADAVIPDETGLLLPAADPAAWIACLRALEERQDELRVLGERFGAQARAEFSWVRMADALEGLVRALARHPAEPRSSGRRAGLTRHTEARPRSGPSGGSRSVVSRGHRRRGSGGSGRAQLDP